MPGIFEDHSAHQCDYNAVLKEERVDDEVRALTGVRSSTTL